MKKFGILWWIEVIGAVALGIFGIYIGINGADLPTLAMIGVVIGLILLDVITSLFKSSGTNI